MSEQLIISVSREYGSGGHEIAQKLAEYYKLPMYDHNLLDEVAASMNVSSKELAEFDEKRRNKFLYRSVMGIALRQTMWPECSSITLRKKQRQENPS